MHLGHLAAARAAMESLELDEVLFMPCSQSAYAKKLMPDSLRLACLRAALRGKRGFALSKMEIRRGGISRTIDTLRELHRKFENLEIFLLLGADQVEKLASWKDSGELSKLAKLIALARPGIRPLNKKMRKGDISLLKIPQYEISSTDILARLKMKKDLAWMVPDAVARILHHSKI